VTILTELTARRVGEVNDVEGARKKLRVYDLSTTDFTLTGQGSGEESATYSIEKWSATDRKNRRQRSGVRGRSPNCEKQKEKGETDKIL